MASQGALDSSGASHRSSGSGPKTFMLPEWMTRWLTIIVCCGLYVVVLALVEYQRQSTPRRILDVGLYLTGAVLGIAVGHLLITQSMRKSRAKLSAVVNQYLNELQQEHEARKGTKKADLLVLPIPYIVSRLRDGGAKGFGYFGGKLLSRDPRLLLDLALDQALAPDNDRKIWNLTQEMKAAHKEPEPSSASVRSSETVAKNVTEAVFSKLRGEVEAAVSEALKKAQEQSRSEPGGSHGESK